MKKENKQSPEGRHLSPGKAQTAKILLPHKGAQTAKILLPHKGAQTAKILLPHKGAQTAKILLPHKGAQTAKILLPHKGAQTAKITLPNKGVQTGKTTLPRKGTKPLGKVQSGKKTIPPKGAPADLKGCFLDNFFYSLRGGMMMKNILLLFMISFNLSAFEIDRELIDTVRTSPVSASDNLANNIMDGDEETSWQLEGERGWLEIYFKEAQYISGLEIIGENAGCLMNVEFLNDTWIPFTGMKGVSIHNGTSYYDLSLDHSVTKKIKISIETTMEGTLKIRELKIYGHDPREVINKIDVESFTTTANSSWTAFADNLLDGEITSEWKTRDSTTYTGEPKAVVRYLKRLYNPLLHDYSNRHTGEVILYLSTPQKVDFVHIYVTDNLDGDISIYTGDNRTWQTAGYLPASTDPGWHKVYIPAGTGDCSSVKIELAGITCGMAGIAEVELWNNNGVKGDTHYPLMENVGVEINESNRRFYFYIDEQGDYDIIMDLIGNPEMQIPVEINGKTYTAHRKGLNKGHFYLLHLGERDLKKGYNYVTLEMNSGETNHFTDLRLIRRKRNQRYSGPDIGKVSPKYLNFDYGLYLHELYVDRNIESFPTLDAYDTTLTWNPLENIEEDKFNGNGITARRLRVNNPGLEMLDRILVAASPGEPKAANLSFLWPEATEVKYRELRFSYIIGKTSDSGAKVSINGIPCSGKDNIFWLKATELNITDGGIFNLTIEITDSQGNVTTKEKEMIVQRIGAFELYPGDEYLFTTEETMTFTGRIDKKPFVMLTINGEEIDYDGTDFSHTIALEPGYNKVVFQLIHRKNFKQLRTEVKHIYREMKEADIYIDTPVNRAYVNTTNVVVKGRINDTNGTRVLINGVEAIREGIFFTSPQIVLQEGTNTLTVQLLRDSTVLKEKILTLFVDTIAPSIEVTNPMDGKYINTQRVNITGLVSDAGHVSVSVDGYSATIFDGMFSASVFMEEGLRDIEVVAIDRGGNISRITIADVMIDSTPPEPFVVAIEPTGWTFNNQPELFFEVADQVSGIDYCELFINSVSCGVYTGSLPVLEDGTHELLIRAVDKAGNEQSASVMTYIDTIPPNASSALRAVAGKDEVTVKWEKPDKDIMFFSVIRNPGWPDGVRTVEVQEIIDTDVEPNQAYVYYMLATDQAGNYSTLSISNVAVPGMGITDYDNETGAYIEYNDATLIISPESMPENVKRIIATEVESPGLLKKAVNPIVSPIYDLSVIIETGGGETLLNHMSFDEPFTGSFAYDKTLLPAGFPEENLGVYYYDAIWCRWIQLPDTAVEVEKNLIFFKTNHFSQFTVQPTLIEDLSPQELSESGHSPFKGKINHGGVSISPEGGSANTGVTEFYLPGKNGFDLELKRTYNSAMARGDARGASINAAMNINFLNPESNATELGAIADQLALSASQSILGQFESKFKKYFQNNGDYAYSMGLGWRLNLPYIRGTNGGVLLRMPDGSFIDIKEMSLIDEKIISYGVYRDLTLESHKEQDFTLTVTQVRADVSILSTISNISSLTSSIDALKDLSNLSFLPEELSGEIASDIPFVLPESAEENIEQMLIEANTEIITDAVTNTGNILSSTADMVPDWQVITAALTMKDGTVYTFDYLGRLKDITDPTGKNKIHVGFDVDTFEISHIEDSMGRRVLFEYEDTETDISGLTIPRIKRMWLDKDTKYNRQVEYEIGNANITDSTVNLSLLSKAIRSGNKDGIPYNREYNYTYDDIDLFSFRGSAKLNIASTVIDIVAACFGVPGGIFSQVTGWDNLTLSANMIFESINPLKSMTGPGIGTIELTNKTETLTAMDTYFTDEFLDFIPVSVQLDLNVDNKIVVEQVSKYIDGDVNPYSVTTYDYDLVYADHGQFYTRKSIITDNNNLITENYYNWIDYEVDQYLDWSDELLANLSSRLLTTPVYSVKTFSDRTVYKDYNGKELETVYFLWNSDKTKILEQQRERSLYNYEKAAYTYDGWGNVTSLTEETRTGNRISKVEKFMYYNSTESVPAAFTGQENPYATEHAAINTEDKIHNLLLGQITRNHNPTGLPGNVTFPEYVDSKVFHTYNNRGQKTGTRIHSSAYGWLETGFAYDYDEAKNNDGSLIGIVKNKGTTEAHTISMDYDYSGATEYYITTEQYVTTPDAADSQLVKSISGYEKISGHKMWNLNPRGYITSYEFDSFGRPVKIVSPSEDDEPLTAAPAAPGTTTNKHPQMSIDYNDTTFVVTVTEKRTETDDNVMIYDYNDIGQLRAITKKYFDYEYNSETGVSPTGNEKSINTSLTYTPGGQIERLIKPVMDNTTATTEFSYDALGALTKTMYTGYTAEVLRGAVNHNFKQFNFDYVTNTKTSIDELGHKAIETLDMKGRVIKTTVYKEGGTGISTEVYYDGAGQQIAAVDANGNITVNRYNELGQLTGQILPANDIESGYDFLIDGNILTGVTPEVEIEYTRSGVKKSEKLGYTGIPETDKIVMTYTSDELGRIYQTEKSYTTHVDPDVIDDNTDWAATPLTEKVTVTETLYYDKHGNKEQIIDGNDKIYSFTYTSRDKVDRETTPTGVTTYEYDLRDNVISMTNPLGNATNADESLKYTGDFTQQTFYDELNRLVVAIQPVRKDQAVSPFVQYRYYPGNKVKQELSGPNGSIVDYSYNKRSLLFTETLRDAGNTTSYTTTHYYDAVGNEAAVLDNDLNRTEMFYDRLNRIVRVVYPDARRTEEIFRYDNNSNRIYTKSGKLEVRNYYDAYNRVYKTTEGPGEEVKAKYWFDPFGNRTRYDNPKGLSYLYTYDELGRVLMEEDPEQRFHYYAYDRNGNKVFSKDPKGSRGFYTYDDENRPILQRVINGADENSIGFDYDKAGSLKSMNADGVVTKYNYEGTEYVPDPYGLITNISTLIGTKSLEVGYIYDVLGRTIGLTYPNRETVNYSMNDLGQLTGVPGYVNGIPEYNTIGLLEKITALNNVSYNYEYDNMNRPVNISYKSNEEEELKAFNLVYNREQNIEMINGSFYQYDESNQLEIAILNGRFEIDAEEKSQTAGRVQNDYLGQEALSFGYTEGDVDIKFDYSSMSIGVDLKNYYEVSRIRLYPMGTEHRIEKEHLALFTANKNLEGEFTRIDEDDWALNALEDGTLEIRLRVPVEAYYLKVHCNFDDMTASNIPLEERVSFVNNKDDIIRVYYMVKWRTEKYSYDANGNRISSSYELDEEDEVSSSYTYYENSDRMMTDGEYGYAYDVNGNLTARGKEYSIDIDNKLFFDIDDGEYWEYEYDLFNRLVRVWKSEEGSADLVEVAGYTYDGGHMRVRKENYQTGEVTYYAYSLSGSLVYQETSEAEYQKYVYVNGQVFAKEIGGVDTSGASVVYEKDSTYYYQSDHLGSTVMITDEAGRIVWQDEVTPFGETGGDVGVLDEEASFTGKDLDRDLGMFYFAARWYLPEVGRFVTVDPIQDSLNWYVYCSNNPLMRIDPTGLFDVIYSEDGEYRVENYPTNFFEFIFQKTKYYSEYTNGESGELIKKQMPTGEAAQQYIEAQNLFESGNYEIDMEALGTLPHNMGPEEWILHKIGHPDAFIHNSEGVDEIHYGKGATGLDSTIFDIYLIVKVLGPIAAKAVKHGVAKGFAKSSVDDIGRELVEAAGKEPQKYVDDLAHVTGKTSQNRNKAIQAAIKENLPGLKLTHTPKYNPYINLGVAKNGAGSQVGKNVFSSRGSLLKTIVHEELHHRWWKKGIINHHPLNSGLEKKFYATVQGYLRMRGFK